MRGQYSIIFSCTARSLQVWLGLPNGRFQSGGIASESPLLSNNRVVILLRSYRRRFYYFFLTLGIYSRGRFKNWRK